MSEAQKRGLDWIYKFGSHRIISNIEAMGVDAIFMGRLRMAIEYLQALTIY